jgi:hypothetical protein
MHFEERAVSDAQGTILMHNVANEEGRRVLKKGSRLSEADLLHLAETGRTTIRVAVLAPDDVHEDEASLALAEAMQTEQLFAAPTAGGRVNLRTQVDGLLEVDVERLLEVNMLPGFAVGTRRQHLVVGPNQQTDNVATVKIVPYAVPRRDLERALGLARARPGIVEVRAFPPDRRVAMLFVAEPSAQDRTRDEYLAPTRERLERLGATIVATEAVEPEEAAIAEAAARLAAAADLLIIAGQTSIVHDDDITLRALRRAGAATALSGAPVEPGNLMAVAYLETAPVLCAPACAKGRKRNVVDLLLPRLLLGDRLERRDVATLGLGGFFTRAERAGDLV